MLAVVLLFATLASQQTQDLPIVVFETEKGPIAIQVDTVRAPLTAANFLKYVDARFYDGGVVNRAVRPDNTIRQDVPIQVIQIQTDPARRREQFPPIPLERTSVTGLTHVDGAVSMARSGPDTARGSFSIVIGDTPEMDFGGKRNADGQGFAVFGRVVRGMNVVKAIQASPTGREGAYRTETLEPPIKILKAYRQVPQTPDFSGRWIVVSPKALAGDQLIITKHDEASITLETSRSAGRRGGRYRATYYLDGTPEGGLRLVAAWEGRKLVLTDIIRGPAYAQRIQRTLSLTGTGDLVIDLRTPRTSPDQEPGIHSELITEPARIVYRRAERVR